MIKFCTYLGNSLWDNVPNPGVINHTEIFTTFETLSSTSFCSSWVIQLSSVMIALGESSDSPIKLLEIMYGVKIIIQY